MTYKEYEQKKQECWEEYVSKHGMKNAIPEEPFNFTFDRAYALGKQFGNSEQVDADTVIQGWVCRDEDNTLTIFYGSNKPSKEDGDDYWSVVFGDSIEYLPQNMFPDVTWDDPEPTRVEIIIKRKKK